MGSFRAAADRVSDQAVLTAADRPADFWPALDDAGHANWLAEGESITYWMRLTHGAARRIAAAATHASVDSLGHVSGSYDIGAASLTKYAEGIVDWTISDSSGKPVKWDPRQAAALLDGLPDAVLVALSLRIGSGEPEAPVSEPDVEEIVEDDETVPNG